MKKSLKTILAAGALAFTLGLSSCNISQNYADKVNAAYATQTTDDDYTYDKVLKDLGEPTVDLTVGLGGTHSGACTWYKYCETLDDVDARREAGKKVESVIVTFLLDVAISADYVVEEAASK